MRVCSTDLRERVAAACDVGDATREQVAARFSVSVAWIRELMRQCRETGSIAPLPHGGRGPGAGVRRRGRPPPPRGDAG